MNFGIKWKTFHEGVVSILGVTLTWWHGGIDSETSGEMPPLFRGLSIGLGPGAIQIGWHWDAAQHMEEKQAEQEEQLDLLQEEHEEAFDGVD